MAEHKQIYKRALCYDIVFRRDVNRELDFAVAACQKYSGRTPRSMMDIACGPGYHARAWSSRGFRAVGVDLMPDMVAFAKSRCAANEKVEWIASDMRDFLLPEPVDFAVCAYDSIDAMVTNTDMLSHFRAVARNLNPSGLYFVECIHPRDCSPFRYGLHRHAGSENGTSVQLTIGVNRPMFDVITGVGEVEFEMRIIDEGAEEVIRERARERLYNPQVFELLAAQSGALEVAGWFGDFDLGQPLDNSGRSRVMLAVFRKAD